MGLARMVRLETWKAQLCGGVSSAHAGDARHDRLHMNTAARD
jgi:hypothetical protein